MDEKTRDAAVQIVEGALAWTGFGHSRDAVEALAEHYEFCPPGTLARLAALEKYRKDQLARDIIRGGGQP